MKIKRICHHYEKWEDYKAGMWRKIPKAEKQRYLPKAIAFTCDHNLYGMWMNKVIEQWPIACEHNLTDHSINRKAWVGHAACCMGIDCPEDVTRMAWHFLTHEQQYKANLKAEAAIKRWERKHIREKAKKQCQRLIWV